MGTPSHHPFLDGIFPEINHPAIGCYWGTPVSGEPQVVGVGSKAH